MDPIKKRKIDDNGVFPADSDVSPTQLLTVDDARKIIEPFTHSQLLDILQNAAVCHSDVLDAIRSIADRDPSKRKLFVRGLGWDTNTEKLRSLFSDYGEVEEGIVILDKATGKSKGYGFVTFRHVDGALLALKEPSKKIDGRMTVTQLASAGVQNPNPAANLPALDSSARKIYVGNVPYDMAAERLLSHFLSYGEVEEGPLGFDKATGKSKGYALFVYKTAEGANASLVDPIKTVDGHQLNCKLAIDGKRGKPGLPVPGEAQGNGIGMMQQQQSQYGGFSGHYPPLNSSMGGTIAQQPSLGVSGGGGGGGGYGSGIGGPYGGATQYGGPGSTGYGGLSGAGRGSSMYGFPPSSTGMPSSGYPESSNYGYPSQHQQTAGVSPAPRVPPGGMYQGGGPPPYI